MDTGFSRNLRNLRKRSFLGQIVVTLLSLEILFFASFCSISLPVPTHKNLERYLLRCEIQMASYLPPLWKDRAEKQFPVLAQAQPEVRFSSYVPILPASLAVAYVLGMPLSVIACSIHFILGSLGSAQSLYLFAGGGGTNYWREPGFGYLVGIICSAWFAAAITPDEERKSWRQLLAASGGVLICHLLGLSWVFGSSISVLLFEGETAYLQFQPWLAEQIRNLSWYTLPYDLLLATILIALSFPLRWLFTILTSPDIANKHRPSVETQLETLQESSI
ncbi:MAG: biotin transporter BioY [Candidatus Obscuribacterales bacterium]|nr:biotin transporter BioY [Candidatus Obscuribacterales bacterium]